MNQPNQQPAMQLRPDCVPQYIPMQWLVQPHPAGFVVITIFDVSGQRVLVMQPDDAVSFIDDITTALPTARSGLIIPGGGLG